MNKLLLAAAMAFAPATAFAQAAPAPAAPTPPAASAPAAAPLPDADPALWVVRDDDTTIYLFGTFHLLDGRPWFNDEVKTAFDASNELVMEAILPEDIGLAAADGHALRDRPAGPHPLLSPDRRAECAAGRALAAAAGRTRSTGSSPGSCR